MSRQHPTRPDGLVDGSRIPWDALADVASDRLDVVDATCPPHRWFVVAVVTEPDGTKHTVRRCDRCPTQEPDARALRTALAPRPTRYLVVPDSQPGPSGRLARFLRRRS